MKKICILMLFCFLMVPVLAYDGHHTNPPSNTTDNPQYGDIQYFQSKIRQKLSGLRDELRYNTKLKQVRKLRQLDKKLEDIFNWLEGNQYNNNTKLKIVQIKVYLRGDTFSTSFSANDNKAFESYNNAVYEYENKIREIIGNRLVDFIPGTPERIYKSYKQHYESKDTIIKFKMNENTEKLSKFETTITGDSFSTSFSENHKKATESLKNNIEKIVNINKTLGKKHLVMFYINDAENVGSSYQYQFSAKTTFIYITPKNALLDKSSRVITGKTFSTSFAKNKNEAIASMDKYFDMWIEREKSNNNIIYVGIGPLTNVGSSYQYKYQMRVEKVSLIKDNYNGNNY